MRKVSFYRFGAAIRHTHARSRRLESGPKQKLLELVCAQLSAAWSLAV
jgi:hypothetical protein